MESKTVSRKKFVSWMAAVSSLLIVPVILKFSARKKSSAKTAKMLTQDGKLVEIDIANIPSKKKKIKEAEIHKWINKKTSL